MTSLRSVPVHTLPPNTYPHRVYPQTSSIQQVYSRFLFSPRFILPSRLCLQFVHFPLKAKHHRGSRAAPLSGISIYANQSGKGRQGCSQGRQVEMHETSNRLIHTRWIISKCTYYIKIAPLMLYSCPLTFYLLFCFTCLVCWGEANETKKKHGRRGGSEKLRKKGGRIR